MTKNDSPEKQIPELLEKPTKKLINWKEELVVWSIVINTIIAIIQLIITLIMISKSK
ncbi:hypothetical protein [endosymbiont GvMRE of Glomus versiforme]|uniref:hypothetical protein n=1 Tax=endosymbiont GvMRE of Glomus versiforme TaxID=2039283 RepID=UPI000EC719B8|nr:hypothetical protein [endosymbiont GvMRE of Glomus versiforme]RHZ37474.1 hypothetical protein GvMRE_I1g383 [endosymbiont GvMRE of Glomus versiforme]